MTKQDLINYIQDKARSVADLATLDTMQKTDDPHYANVLYRQLKDLYQAEMETAMRAEDFDNIFK